MKALVLIPCYQDTLSPDEKWAVGQCARVLGGHDISVLAPDSLALPAGLSAWPVERFDPSFFTSRQGYNRLLLSRGFYERFTRYGHILIYQLDAFVFKDELAYWCAQGYDYIGAPWEEQAWVRSKRFRSKMPIPFRYLGFAHKLYHREFLVGNGGFSLRRVDSFLDALDRLAPRAARWTGNEDAFWSCMAPMFLRKFSIPPAAVARRFAIEEAPRRHYEEMARVLPFGCHAWRRYDPEFWLEHMKPSSPARTVSTTF